MSDALQDALGRRDINGLIAAMSGQLTICACADGKPCTRDHLRMCLCTEPHYWGGTCRGPAVDQKSALPALLERLRAIKTDPTGMSVREAPDRPDTEFVGYIVSETEMDLFIDLVARLQFEGASTNG